MADNFTVSSIHLIYFYKLRALDEKHWESKTFCRTPILSLNHFYHEFLNIFSELHFPYILAVTSNLNGQLISIINSVFFLHKSHHSIPKVQKILVNLTTLILYVLNSFPGILGEKYSFHSASIYAELRKGQNLLITTSYSVTLLHIYLQVHLYIQPLTCFGFCPSANKHVLFLKHTQHSFPSLTFYALSLLVLFCSLNHYNKALLHLPFIP